MWPPKKCTDAGPRERAKRLTPRQIRAMLGDDPCCADCGDAPIEIHSGHPCCGSDTCRQQLSVVRESHQLAALMRARRAAARR